MLTNRRLLPALLFILSGLFTLTTGCAELLFDDAAAVASAFIDDNCNGVWEQDAERPLADVCIWADDRAVPDAPACTQPAARSNSAGGWQDFSRGYPTCQDVFIHAETPPGFMATSATIVNDCVAQFGFAPAGSCTAVDVLTPEDVAAAQRRTDLLRWGGLLLLGAGVGLLWLRRR